MSYARYSGIKSTFKYMKQSDCYLKIRCLNGFLVPVGAVTGSGFENSDLLDADPAEKGLDPQHFLFSSRDVFKNKYSNGFALNGLFHIERSSRMQ